LGLVVLFDRISSSFEILCFYSGTIVNTYNGITYNEGSNEFLIVILYVSLIEISRLLYERIGWIYLKFKLKLLGRMQNRVSPTYYINISISSKSNVNVMFVLTINNWSQILELYLNSKPRRENSYKMMFT
jgi:hypothetical protein